MRVSKTGTPSKKRLESLLSFLIFTNPALFNYVDKIFNFPRYIDFKNLEPLFERYYGKVLEIGCGKGYFAEFFAQRGNLYYGIDPESEEIDFFRRCARYKKNGDRLRAITGDGMCLPFPDKSFDLVFCNCVIEHIPNDEMVLQETARVLKPGGEMIFTFPNTAYKPRFFKRLLFRYKFLRWLADPSLLHYFDFPNIEAAEDWYFRERWQHARRGYIFNEVKKQLAEVNMQIKDYFYFHAHPVMNETWELCTFSRLNCIFPLSLLIFTPLMKLMHVTKHGNEKQSDRFAIKAILK